MRQVSFSLIFSTIFLSEFWKQRIDKYFLGASPGIITDALALVQAINVFEVKKSSFAPRVKLEPLCQSLFLPFRFNVINFY